MNYDNDDKNKKIVFFILLGVGVLLTFYQYIYADLMSQIVFLEKDISEKNNALFQYSDIKEEGGQKDILELKNEVKNLQKNVPYVRDIPGIFVDLNDIFIENALESKVMIFGKPSQVTKFNYFTINFTVRGKKQDALKMVTQLENFKRLVSIDDMSIQMESMDMATLTLTMKIYYIKSAQDSKEPSDYDFMEGKYGVYDNLSDALKSFN